MQEDRLIEKLIRLLPYWHYRIDKPFKLFLKDKMSLETYYCLQMLRQNGPTTMSELCQRLKISKQQATHLIETLHRHHFVERSINAEDRRFITIQVTGQALDYIEKHIYGDTAFIDQVRQRLSAEELARLEGAVDTLLELLPKLNPPAD